MLSVVAFVGACGIGASPLAAQYTTKEVALDVAALASPGTQVAAAARLGRAPDLAVPALRAVLREVVDRDAHTLRMALLVLGKAGRAAGAAMPELLDAYRMGREADVRRQALWAIGQVAPFAEAAHPTEDVLVFLRQHVGEAADRQLLQCVDVRLQLGPSPTVERLGEYLAMGGNWATAALEATAGLAPTERHRYVRWFEDVRTRLQQWLTPEGAMEGVVYHEALAGLAARALWLAGHRDALVARGLVSHWDADARLAGIELLHDDKGMTRSERLGVVWALWDADVRVRDLALGTLRGWRDGFALAVPTLVFAESSPDRAWAAAARRAIDRWLHDGLRGDRRRSFEVTAAACSLLRGEPSPFDVRRAAAEHCQDCADLVFGAREFVDGKLTALADFTHANGLAHAVIVRAFVSCLGARQVDGCREAVDALVALGPAVLRCEPEVGALLMQTRIRRWEIAPAAEAWIAAGPAANVAELRLAVASPKWTIAVRALLEGAQRGGAAAAALAEVAIANEAMARADVSFVQDREQAVHIGGGWSSITSKCPPHAVRAATTLLLLAAGDARWREPVRLAAAAEALEVDPARIADALLAAGRGGTWAQLAVRLEPCQRTALTLAMGASVYAAAPR